MDNNMVKNTEPKKSSVVDKVATIILVAVVVYLAVMVGMSFSSTKSGTQDAKGMKPSDNSGSSTINVSVQTLKSETFVQTTTLGAEITNTLDSYNLSTDIGGKVTKLLVQKDADVKAGDIIAYIDPSVAGSQYKEQAVKSQLSGHISTVPVYVGQTVSTGATIATIGNVGDLEVEAYLPEKYLSTVTVGMKATFVTSAWPEDAINATVKSIGDTVDSSNRTFKVILSFDQDARLKSGMYVTLTLVTKTQDNVLMIPSTAVSAYLDSDVVYVVEDGTAKRRTVTKGDMSKGNVIITSGLSEGENVVVKGSVTDGSAVSIVE